MNCDAVFASLGLDKAALSGGTLQVTSPIDRAEIARVARVEGRVIVQAVILMDGSVGDVEVLSSQPSDMGFEQAAIDAVRQWRFEPATQAGRPVDVFHTIVVYDPS